MGPPMPSKGRTPEGQKQPFGGLRPAKQVISNMTKEGHDIPPRRDLTWIALRWHTRLHHLTRRRQ